MTKRQNSGSINPSPKMIWAGWICSVVFILILVVIAIKVPNPTPFQYHVFVLIMALSASGWVAFVPGFLLAKYLGNTQLGRFCFQGGGAIVAFLVVWFFVPAAIRKTIAPGFGLPATISVRDVPPTCTAVHYIRRSYLNSMMHEMTELMISKEVLGADEARLTRRNRMRDFYRQHPPTNILDRLWTVRMTNLRPDNVSIVDVGVAVLLAKGCSLKDLLPNMREEITGIKLAKPPVERRPVIVLPTNLLALERKLPALLSHGEVISFSFYGVHITALAYLARQGIEFQNFIQTDPSQVPRKIWIIPYAVTSTGLLLPLLGEGIDMLQESLDQESHYLFVGLSEKFGPKNGFTEATSNFVVSYAAEFGESYFGIKSFRGDFDKLTVEDESVWGTTVNLPSSGKPCNPNLNF